MSKYQQNQKLKALVEQTGLSQTRFRKEADIEKTHFRRLLAGHFPWPQWETRQRIRRTLADHGVVVADDEHMGFRRPPHAADRRAGNIADLDSAIEACWRIDDERGTSAVLPEVRKRLVDGRELLGCGKLRVAQTGRVQRSVAELSRLAGSAEFDRQNYDAAHVHFRDALNLARQSGDPLFEANVLSCLSLQATYEGRESRALSLVLAASDTVAGHNSPRVHALLAMREAYAYAALGDVKACHDALDRSERFLGMVDVGTEDPEWSRYFDEAKLFADAGIARGRAGEYAAADGLLDQAFDRSDPSRRRLKVFHLLWKARVQLGLGELSHACVTAGRAAVLSEDLESPRTRYHLAEIDKDFGRYARERPVKEFRELLRDSHVSLG